MRVSIGSNRTLFRGAGPLQRLFLTKILTYYIRPNGMTNSDQILHGDQTRGKENFYMVDHAPALTKYFATRTLTYDLFAVANLQYLNE